MIRVLAFLLSGSAAIAAPTAGFQSHYIPLGYSDSSIAIVVDGAGNIFVVSQAMDVSQKIAIRATKTDRNGKLLASIDFGQGVHPMAATVDRDGNLFVTGDAFVAKLDNALTRVAASATIVDHATGTNANAIVADAAGDVYVAGSSSDASFPTTLDSYLPNPPHVDPADPNNIPTYGFVVEYSPGLGSILHSTLFGGATSPGCLPEYGPCIAQTHATAITIEPSGMILVGGDTNTVSSQLGGSVTLLIRFRSDLSAVTAQGGFGHDVPLVFMTISAMTLDSQGNVVFVGPGRASLTPGSKRVFVAIPTVAEWP